MRWIDMLKVAGIQVAFIAASWTLDALRGQPLKGDAYLISVGAIACIALARSFTIAHNLSRKTGDES